MRVVFTASGVVDLLAPNGGLVLAKLGPDSQDNSGKIPLHYAAIEGKKEIVEFLIDKGANKEAQDLGGQTPLDWVSYINNNGSHDAIIKLLSK